MRVLGFNGRLFADLNVTAGMPDDLAGASQQPVTHSRTGGQPAHAGVTRDVRAIPVTFLVKPGFATEPTLLNLLGFLRFDANDERALTAEWNDGVGVTVQASVGPYQFRGKNQVEVIFYTTDSLWRKVLPETKAATQTISTAGVTMALVNTGHATANLLVTIAGTSTGGTGSAGKLAFRRTFTITNNGTDPLARQPIRLDLGDTTTWVATGKALADGSNVYLFTADGTEARRQLVNFNDVKSYLWFVVEDLAAGVSREYVICYGNALATAPLDFSSTIDGKRNAPVFDTSSDRRTVSSATTTTITVAGTPWRADQWNRGIVRILTGTQAGQEATITATTTSQITFGALPGAPANGDAFLITMSQTSVWIYPIAKVERADFKRGLWWINRGQSPPSRFSFDAPGAWHPILTIQNNDDKVQKLWTPFNPGATDDFVAILDVDYGWDGRFAETGNDREVANGVTFSSPLPITDWRVGWQLQNPNGMVKAIFGMRESGATDWEVVTSSGTASDTLVNTAAALFSTVPVEGVTRHLVAMLVPYNDTEIPLDWIKDTGTATSGSATQLNDNTKAWKGDQFNGGRIRLLSGAGAPQTRTVLDSSPNTVDPTANFSPAPDSTTRYQITNKQLLATLRSHDLWVVSFDASSIGIGALSAEADNYDLALTIRLDGGSPAAGPYQRARVGLDGRRLLFGTGQALRIDGERRAVEIITADTEAFVRTIADPDSVRIQDVDADNDPFRAGDVFALTPGSHELFFTWDAGNSPIGATIDAEWTEGSWG